MKAFYGVVLLLCLASAGHAMSIMLAWDYVQGTDPAVSFAVYRQVGCFGDTSRRLVPLSPQTYTDPGPFLDSLLYCYNVTAVDAAGQESARSNTVSFQVPTQRPDGPTNVRGTVMP